MSAATRPDLDATIRLRIDDRLNDAHLREIFAYIEALEAEHTLALGLESALGDLLTRYRYILIVASGRIAVADEDEMNVKVVAALKAWGEFQGRAAAQAGGEDHGA